ncbi:nitrilase-related carbon-nitrogen hydrolase [Gordonia sp. (in: high G+C Gram-positive bacteria)]|uniref:nitrilase-related carbon-nitrogen hydrolase n=1 Tax=Gordonia sp. (in: high G+C Gram-positive bacteria) TaxID=84139 RepID=UPI0026180B5D|nr:nitrilase-related carbon-nitrogen hydrolase [Gordonia sp. (in: high G+C Gram-positive bacteria)]HMS77040.1 nitrilase-related carbon-nitrogen hydrolase [Gordonia sp. (in: high G+C Gram-positive bacteria)]
MRLITAPGVPSSPARVDLPAREALRVGAVQHRWHDSPDDLLAELDEGIALAAREGARVVFLPELTLSRYPAFVRGGDDPGAGAEDLRDGPTVRFATEAAGKHGVLVHASLYERDGASLHESYGDGLGFNTAVLAGPDGLITYTRKLHIPVTEGYYEDTYFRGGPVGADPTGRQAYPVHTVDALDGARIGMPTCWDEWFPEVARMYSLAGAEVIVYPTAIGSEPGHPDFDTQPLWQQVIVGNGIANGTFMIAPNRHGDEGAITFYGSSFISDPYGRILVQAPRDESAVLVADLDLDQRRDWLTLFPFLATRRPDTYGRLTEPVDPSHPLGGSN